MAITVLLYTPALVASFLSSNYNIHFPSSVFQQHTFLMLTFSSLTQLPWCVLCSDTLVCSKMLLSLILCSHLLHVQFDIRKCRHFSESVHINFIMLLNILVAYQPLGEICTLKNYSCKYIFVKICLVSSIWRQISVSVSRVCSIHPSPTLIREKTWDRLTPDVKKSPFSLCYIMCYDTMYCARLRHKC